VNKTLNSTLNLMIDDPPSYEELAGLAARLDKVYVESAFRALLINNEVEKARDRLYNIKDRNILQEADYVCAVLGQLCKDVFFDQEDQQ
jgi:hypothetical protein